MSRSRNTVLKRMIIQYTFSVFVVVVAIVIYVTVRKKIKISLLSFEKLNEVCNTLALGIIVCSCASGPGLNVENKLYWK